MPPLCARRSQPIEQYVPPGQLDNVTEVAPPADVRRMSLSGTAGSSMRQSSTLAAGHSVLSAGSCCLYTFPKASARRHARPTTARCVPPAPQTRELRTALACTSGCIIPPLLWFLLRR
eukprot:3401985-Prymnesium_polylepis.1